MSVTITRLNGTTRLAQSLKGKAHDLSILCVAATIVDAQREHVLVRDDGPFVWRVNENGHARLHRADVAPDNEPWIEIADVSRAASRRARMEATEARKASTESAANAELDALRQAARKAYDAARARMESLSMALA